MTLVVSLRVLDGVILAADSLATLSSRLELNVEHELDCPKCSMHVRVNDVYRNAHASATCPNCAEDVVVPLKKPAAITTASSTLSFAQKVIPFLDTYGIAVFGLSAIGSKSLFNHIKGFERQLRTEQGSGTLLGVQVVATKVRDFCREQFELAYNEEARTAMPEVVFGLQVVGYDPDDSGNAKTIELTFGSTYGMQVSAGLGITAAGDTRFADGMLDLCTRLQMKPVIEALSLQDAIDYAEFMVRTTADVHRFANIIPTVGGDVDIALITNYSEFRWIKSKALARVLEPQYVPLHI